MQGPESGPRHSVSFGRWPERRQADHSYIFKEPTSTNNLEKAGRGFFPESLQIMGC